MSLNHPHSGEASSTLVTVWRGGPCTPGILVLDVLSAWQSLCRELALGALDGAGGNLPRGGGPSAGEMGCLGSGCQGEWQGVLALRSETWDSVLLGPWARGCGWGAGPPAYSPAGSRVLGEPGRRPCSWGRVSGRATASCTPQSAAHRRSSPCDHFSLALAPLGGRPGRAAPHWGPGPGPGPSLCPGALGEALSIWP